MSRFIGNGEPKKALIKKGGLPTWAWIAISGGGALALGTGAYFLFFRKKKDLTTGGVTGGKGFAPGEEEDEEDEEEEEEGAEEGMEEGAIPSGGGGGGGGPSGGGGGGAAPAPSAGAEADEDEGGAAPAPGTPGAAAAGGEDAAEAAAEAKAERAEYVQEFANEYAEDLSERGISKDEFLRKPEPEQNAIIIALTSASGESPPPFVTAPPPGSVPAVPGPRPDVKGLQREVSGYAVTPMGRLLGRGFSGEDDELGAFMTSARGATPTPMFTPRAPAPSVRPVARPMAPAAAPAGGGDDEDDAAEDAREAQIEAAQEAQEERNEAVQEFAQEYAEDLAERGMTPAQFLSLPPGQQNSLMVAMMSAAGEAPPASVTSGPVGPAALPAHAVAKGARRTTAGPGGRTNGIGYLNSFFSGAHLIR